MNNIFSISPIDGRYQSATENLIPFFSEAGLMNYRIKVEIEWFIFLCNRIKLPGTKILSQREQNSLRKLYILFDHTHAEKIKKIEHQIKHDVKAIEYFIKHKLKNSPLKKLTEYIHFGCTSEDINNLSYALMLKEAINQVILPQLIGLITQLKKKAAKYKNEPMLARTHGQPATPTTMGKEIINFVARLERQINNPTGIDFLGKWNGAVGNFNAHTIAFPKQDWIKISSKFIESLGLTPNLITTQIEPHDFLCELFHTFHRINAILIDSCKDIWTYISLEYFVQRIEKKEVGSSTMPHKVNPIDFENAEGNLGIANALFTYFTDKLPISRLQRDLSDSTVMRNIGVAFSHTTLAYQNFSKGLEKIDINSSKLKEDLENHPEVLTEAIQTLLRKNTHKQAYESLKDLARGKKISMKSIRKFIEKTPMSTSDKTLLKKLTPATYTGLATKLVKWYLKNSP